METSIAFQTWYLLLHWFYTNTKFKKNFTFYSTMNCFVLVCIHNLAFDGPQKSRKMLQFVRKTSLPISGICHAHWIVSQSLLWTMRSSSTKIKVCIQFKVLFDPIVRFQSKPKYISRMTKWEPCLKLQFLKAKAITGKENHSEGLCVVASVFCDILQV